MNADDLRALQTPVKQRYRDDPGSAAVMLSATGTLDVGALTCRLQTAAGPATAGLHRATGGDGSQACAADMLLQSLIACAGVTLSAVATSMGIAVRGGTITAEADWDARGTLGVDKSAPVGLKAIRLRFDLDTDAEAPQLEKLVALTERYCVVYQTLKNPPEIGASF